MFRPRNLDLGFKSNSETNPPWHCTTGVFFFQGSSFCWVKTPRRIKHASNSEKREASLTNLEKTNKSSKKTETSFSGPIPWASPVRTISSVQLARLFASYGNRRTDGRARDAAGSHGARMTHENPRIQRVNGKRSRNKQTATGTTRDHPAWRQRPRRGKATFSSRSASTPDSLLQSLTDSEL